MTDNRSARDLPEDAVPAGPGGHESDTVANVSPNAADMQALIGRQLRAVFDDIAKQPVPDRFIELMKQLDKRPASG